jgi:uncharacterized protein (DUF1499 family)
MAKSTCFKALQRAAIGLVAAGAAIGVVWTYRNRKLFTVSDVTTGESFDYPELRAHVYFCPPEEAIDTARRVIESRSDFHMVQCDVDECRIIAEAGSAIGSFIDDFEVRAVRLGPRHTRVIVRSHSRAGRGDLGENARHIRTLQEAMDEILVGG